MSRSLKTYKAVVTWREERSVVLRAANETEAREKATQDWERFQSMDWETHPTAAAEFCIKEVPTGEAKR